MKDKVERECYCCNKKFYGYRDQLYCCKKHGYIFRKYGHISVYPPHVKWREERLKNNE